MTLALVLAAQAVTQTKGRARAGTAAAKAQAASARPVPLPASDAVVAVDLRRLFGEAVPRALAGNEERAAQVDRDVEQFKARTGIDPRAFDTLTAGARLASTPSGAVTIDNPVAVATGAFDMDAVVASARSAPGSKLSEQNHAGRTVYVLGVNDQLRLFGLLRVRVTELAFASPEANTLAVGTPQAVRAVLDAQAGRGRVDAALLNGARVGGGAIIAFAGNVPPGTFAGVDVGLPNVNRSIAAIRGFSGNIGMTAAGYQMTSALRTQNAGDARQLHDTLQALKSVAPGLISVAGERAKFAQRAIDSLKITAQGAEVQMRFDLAQEDLGALLRVL